MNIIERGRAFLRSLRELASRSVWDWKCCPRCGSTLTCKWGTYDRHPWFFEGRSTVAVQRHMCHSCHHTYSEGSALLIRGSWYAREVHRCPIDHWQHLGTSLQRTAEVLRSWVGKQERYLLWRPLDPVPWRPSSAIWPPAPCTAGWIRRGGWRKGAWRDSWKG